MKLVVTVVGKVVLSVVDIVVVVVSSTVTPVTWLLA